MSARIFIADDKLASADNLTEKLSREYFRVIVSHSGSEAIDLVSASLPDLIILSLSSSKIDNFEVCRRFKADPQISHIPIIIVTNSLASEERVKGLDAGADDFLDESSSDKVLFARVRNLSRLKMTMDEWRMREQTSEALGGLADEISFLSQKDIVGAKVLIINNGATSDVAQIFNILDTESYALEMASDFTVQHKQDLEDYDLIIAPLDLPGLDSLRFISELRAERSSRHISILTISESADDVRLAKALDLGVNDCVIKPMDRYELIARVRTQVKRRRYHNRLKRSYQHNLTLALTDSLTGLFNRRYILKHLDAALDSARKLEKPMAIVLFDIDYFKQINDNYGHGAGDKVLRELAERVSYTIRDVDVVARYGGEEFIVILPDVDEASAFKIAERLRWVVAEREFYGDDLQKRDIPVTISVGIALSDKGNTTAADIIACADRALYEAKRMGRNRIAVDPKDPG